MKVVSLFSGCGGMDLGFLQADFDIIWANDMDDTAVKTYTTNIGNHIVKEDIRNISVDEIPSCDVLLAGFPCQPFSNAGNRGGITDSRGNLFLECLRVIEDKQPKVVVFENVQGLLSIKNEDETLLFKTICDLLSACGEGYDVFYKLINTVDYGVPQKRKRIFVVAYRKDLSISYEFPKEITNENSEELTVKHIITFNAPVWNQEEVMEFSPQIKSLVPFIKEGGSWKDIPYEYLPDRLKKIRDNMQKYHSPNFLRRYGREEVNGTITASATPEKCGIIHPIEDRRYSVREVARIQSFPDDFVFVGKSIRDKYKVIGNAVPPKMAFILAKSITEHLHDEKET